MMNDCTLLIDNQVYSCRFFLTIAQSIFMIRPIYNILFNL